MQGNRSLNYARRVPLQFFCFFRRSFAHPKKALSGLKQPGHLRARAVFCMPSYFSPRGIIRPLRLFNIHPDFGAMDRRILYILIKALRPIVIGRQRDQYSRPRALHSALKARSNARTFSMSSFSNFFIVSAAFPLPVNCGLAIA